MNITELVSQQRAYFNTNATRNISFRIKQLKLLRKVLQENEQALIDAIYADLKKSRYNTIMTELSLIYGEIAHSISALPKWSRKKHVRMTLLNFPERSYLLPEPYGVTYIAGAWNYPYQLTLLPLVSAIAAGNTAVVKPSELAPNTSRAMASIINHHFLSEYIHFVEGGAEVASEILQERFDKIFFTGGTAIGKLVYQAAAKHMTPVTLELGGKNPAIILPDCNIKVAAKRIIWGKFANAGQTCVAPDYLLVHSSIEQQLLDELKKLLMAHFSPSIIGDNFMAIVNQRHFERLVKLINPDKIYFGGETNKEQLFIYPTILHNVTFDDDIMKEEIFGPLLPVVRFDDLSEVVEKIKNYDKPLSFYVFGKKSKVTNSLFSELSFGGGSLNDTVMYFANKNLPLGGVGASGIGSYHGKYGFETFSHYKAIMEKGTWMEPWFLKMPPYKEWKLKIMRWFIEN
jgi:aldehyde dehydrogenase (NAD+)